MRENTCIDTQVPRHAGCLIASERKRIVIVMKLSFLHCVALAGMLGCCSGTKADAVKMTQRRNTLPISHDVVVREVKGTVEYAYDSTGWKKLEKDKLLKAGATIRTQNDSSVLLKVEHQSTFYRISSESLMQLTPETPESEINSSRMAKLRAQRLKRVSSTRLSGITIASGDSE